MPRTLQFTVPDGDHGRKLCAFLRGTAQLSYALCATLRHTPGAVTRADEPVRMIDRVYAGDVIRVRLPAEQTTLIPTPIPIDVLYADADLLAINKSGYIATHPSHAHRDDTLANAVTHHLAERHIEGVFHAVGRLDKGTSGVALCALHSFAASRMAHQTEKTYIAMADGALHGSGVIDVPIYRPDPDKTLRACGDTGESARTRYTVLASAGGKSLVRLMPETGRTHQIRVHMAYIGTPLTGDSLYGTAVPELGRHLLHCAEVRLPHPISGEALCFTAPLPPEFCDAIRRYMGDAYASAFGNDLKSH